MAKMSVDDKLGLDLFHTDEHNPHITVNEDYDDMEEIRKVLLACPAGLYHYENGKVTFSHEGVYSPSTRSSRAGITPWAAQVFSSVRADAFAKAAQMCCK